MSEIPQQPQPQPAKPKSKSPIVLIILGLAALFLFGIVVLAIVAAMVMPVMGRARESARRVASASNLSQMGKGIILYADAEGKEVGPSDPRKLFPSYINDVRVFKRPGYPENQDVHYMLVAGAKQDDFDSLAVFENPPPGQEKFGRNILRCAGNVEWVTDSEFKRLLALTEKKYKDENRPFKVVPISLSGFNK